MILLPLVFFLTIALTIWLVFMSEASKFSKILVAVLFVVSLWLRYSRFALAGFFLQVALSISVALYQKVKSQ
ncbi:MAG: hypothetical protein PHY43_04475 [Verrucomicrobiales bacterium]|nr:hypothetical protein [Verrucomicrobiales bacterium]